MTIEKRMEEWSKKCKQLSKKFREYEESYRKKIYPKLTEEEKKKRNYRIINGKEYCDRIKTARQAYFKEEIKALIAELVEIQQSESSDALNPYNTWLSFPIFSVVL